MRDGAGNGNSPVGAGRVRENGGCGAGEGKKCC